MNRLSDLMYTQPQQQEEPLFPDINQQIRYGMQYAQNTLKPKSYWDYRLKMNDFETPDDEFANKYRLQGSPTPTVAPGPGNYSTPHNPRATIPSPDGRGGYITPEEFEMLQRRLQERRLRMKR